MTWMDILIFLYNCHLFGFSGVQDSPLMTWGEIEGTPFQLDGGSTPLLRATPGPQFKIPEVPKRDHLGMKLAEKASKAHRDKKQQAISRVRSNFASYVNIVYYHLSSKYL